MQKASRDMTGGILHYAAVHPDVQVQLYGVGTPRGSWNEFASWRPDGIIIGTSGSETIRAIAKLGCSAALFVNAEAPDSVPFRHASIYCDNRAVAEAAMKLLAGKQLHHFAFVGTRAGDEWSAERERVFRQLARSGGGTYSAFLPPSTAERHHGRELDAMTEWICALPKPCGIFAACDARAKDVLDACHNSKAAVPEQVMVLGVDDEEFICRQMEPTLSSVVPDFGKGGYLAAETLVKLISGRRRTLPRRTFGVQGVIERTSTSDPNGAGRMVSRAKEFIHAYAASDVSVDDVAKASGASLRLLQKNFKSITGTTICDALQSRRLQHVCSLLTQTTTPIGQIGELCGFGNESYLKKLFLRRFGCTMRDYRKKSSAPG